MNWVIINYTGCAWDLEKLSDLPKATQMPSPGLQV